MTSGVKWYTFWLSTYIWDLMSYSVVTAIIILIFIVSDVPILADISNGNLQPIYLLMVFAGYGSAILPNIYLLHYFFNEPSTGFFIVLIYNGFTGSYCWFIVLGLSMYEKTRGIGHALDTIFATTFPNYNLLRGITNILTNYVFNYYCNVRLMQESMYTSLSSYCAAATQFNLTTYCCANNCGDQCFNQKENYLDWDSPGIGAILTFLFVQAIGMWIVLAVIEVDPVVRLIYKCRPKVYITIDELKAMDNVGIDEDVKAEKEKILTMGDLACAQENSVVLSGLTKYYGGRKVVDGLYVAIPKGECFGLLGVNGAGKSTTFRMLTGQEIITAGNAYLSGKDVKGNMNEVRQHIGYCPQFDALIDKLTGEEMLWMYCNIRGIPVSEIQKTIDHLLAGLTLTKHKRKLTSSYSGGNKRKLSAAIALVGDSPVIFLDEPTTGIDPVAKRTIWQTLSKLREKGKTLILTTHSMAEAEVLCTKLSIMVGGKNRCLGGTQYLKNKFGEGYTLVARVSYTETNEPSNLDDVKNFIEVNFDHCVLTDKHENLLQYYIPKGDLTWAGMFDVMEKNKAQLQIEDYSVSQTSLEQVFLSFARSQPPPIEEPSEDCEIITNKVKICTIPDYVIKEK